LTNADAVDGITLILMPPLMTVNAEVVLIAAFVARDFSIMLEMIPEKSHKFE
jgi:hypothetical protein